MNYRYNFNQVNDIDIRTILKYYNIELINNKQLRCINKNHEDKNPSAYIGDNNKVNCKKCKTSLSVIDVIREIVGVNDLKEASRIAINIAGETENNFKCSNINNINKATTKKQSIKNKNNEAKKENIDRYQVTYNYCFGDIGKNYLPRNIKEVEKYLIERGLDAIKLRKVLEANKITYSLDGFNQIVFFFEREKIGIYRDKNINTNMFLGNANFTKIVANKNSKLLFIVEGIFDAFSLAEENQNVICLNSVQNVGKLIECIKNNIDEKFRKNKIEIILALDNDDAGNKAEAEIVKALYELNYTWTFYKEHKKRNLKDINDLKKILSKKNKQLIDFLELY